MPEHPFKTHLQNIKKNISQYADSRCGRVHRAGANVLPPRPPSSPLQCVPATQFVDGQQLVGGLPPGAITAGLGPGHPQAGPPAAAPGAAQPAPAAAPQRSIFAALMAGARDKAAADAEAARKRAAAAAGRGGAGRGSGRGRGAGRGGRVGRG